MLDLVALVLACGLVVDPEIMAAIVRVESGGSIHALSVNGGFELVREPRTRDEAVWMAGWLERHGYNFDAGLAQVNSANLARLGLDVVSVFDPCANLRAASRVLGECYERALAQRGGGERALMAALSCYNTGNFTRGVANGYVRAVRASAVRLEQERLASRAHGSPVGPSSRSGDERSEDRAPVRARGARRKLAAANRRPDAFAHRVLDAFGAARSAGSEDSP